MANVTGGESCGHFGGGRRLAKVKDSKSPISERRAMPRRAQAVPGARPHQRLRGPAAAGFPARPKRGETCHFAAGDTGLLRPALLRRGRPASPTDRSLREARCRSRRPTTQIPDQGARGGPIFRRPGADRLGRRAGSGGRAGKLPAGKSVFRSSGTATVNDKPVVADTQIRPGDTVRTGKDSEIVFVVSDCSMLLRAESHLVLEGDAAPFGASRGLQAAHRETALRVSAGARTDRTATATGTDTRNGRIRRIR